MGKKVEEINDLKYENIARKKRVLIFEKTNISKTICLTHSVSELSS